LPFGEPLSVSGSITNNLRFPGQYYDAETGLHQNYFRDYKPEIGRYVQPDPLNLGTAKILFPEITNTLTDFYKSNPSSQNLYIYVQNATSRYSDPLGLLGWDTVIKEIVKQVAKKIGGKIVDSGDIESDSEGDADRDGVPNFLDPEYLPNQPCIQCHTGPRLPLGPPCKPQK
jgi:RHS repeat-associated protein